MSHLDQIVIGSLILIALGFWLWIWAHWLPDPKDDHKALEDADYDWKPGSHELRRGEDAVKDREAAQSDGRRRAWQVGHRDPEGGR